MFGIRWEYGKCLTLRNATQNSSKSVGAFWELPQSYGKTQPEKLIFKAKKGFSIKSFQSKLFKKSFHTKIHTKQINRYE